MIEQSKLDRITELTRISRERPLAPGEAAERELLRREYLDSWRRGAANALDRTYIKDENGNVKKLNKK